MTFNFQDKLLPSRQEDRKSELMDIPSLYVSSEAGNLQSFLKDSVNKYLIVFIKKCSVLSRQLKIPLFGYYNIEIL